MPRRKQYQYNIRLLRSDREIRDAFRRNFAPDEQQELKTYEWEGIADATLYIGQIYYNTPGWIEFLRDQSQEIPDNFVCQWRRSNSLCSGC